MTITMDKDLPDVAGPLLRWYDRHRRDLPWRAGPGHAVDPYRVWLSEIMLQQTTVSTVIPRFETFLRRWPTIDALAAAKLDDVLHEWQGLGYYARARNLHACARVVVERHGGRFPDTEPALRDLPGIGRYTAAAIAAIAFDRRAVVVDGNVERVVARLFALETPLPAAKKQLAAYADELTPHRRAGDFAQAMMDLGATVCKPRGALCDLCPVSRSCAGRDSGSPERWPIRAAKKPRPVRRGVAYWLRNGDGEIMLRRRAESGLLGGMMEIPSTPWRAETWTAADAGRLAPAAAEWHTLPGLVHHTFTHFHLELTVMTGQLPDEGHTGDDRTRDDQTGGAARGAAGSEGVWCSPDSLSDYALPTVMKKVVAHVLPHTD